MLRERCFVVLQHRLTCCVDLGQRGAFVLNQPCLAIRECLAVLILRSPSARQQQQRLLHRKDVILSTVLALV